jgi:hypothetical protein
MLRVYRRGSARADARDGLRAIPARRCEARFRSCASRFYIVVFCVHCVYTVCTLCVHCVYTRKGWLGGGITAADMDAPQRPQERIVRRTTDDAGSTKLAPASLLSAMAQEDEDPDDDTMAHREITRDHVVAMAEAVGLDDELLDSMVDALDGDLQGTAGMLHEQGAPDPWEALEVKQAKAAAAATNANAKSVAIATLARNIDAKHTKAADPAAEHADALADKYLTPAHRLSKATPPTLSMALSAAAPRSFSAELMALKPSHLVKRAIAVGVDQAALEAAQDGEHPREEIVALIVAKANATPSSAGGDPQPMAHDADRSELFSGAKKPANRASSHADTSGESVKASAIMSRAAAGGRGSNGSLAPSAKVLEAQQRVRQNLESLEDLSDRTKQMEQNSQQFASMATQLRKKKQFGLF